MTEAIVSSPFRKTTFEEHYVIENEMPRNVLFFRNHPKDLTRRCSACSAAYSSVRIGYSTFPIRASSEERAAYTVTFLAHVRDPNRSRYHRLVTKADTVPIRHEPVGMTHP